ncbi:protelomerase family protein [Xenorhabdus bovienii]|uniref:protelomerase family protein n=1 Tax=Xenorhabdus bovienii TaxID=40576 RepID=UPI0023B2880C|nr:protelomerase family protein [Xenorhabdus bovienii]MDE9588206.1 telomere resolvase [Xenorhabdus bovienii]
MSQKIKVGELINALVHEIDEIDASEMPQGEKTRKYRAAASRFKNALFTDKRKFRGKGLEKRISSNTYNAYMTRARKRFDDRLHHFFSNNVTKIAEKYPLFSDELNSWLELPSAEIRQKFVALQNQLKCIIPLTDDLNKIKLGNRSAENKILRLAKKYPAWAFALFDLNSDEWLEWRNHLYKLLGQGRLLLEDLLKLKINHDVLYSLQLSQAERTSIQNRWNEVLSNKKRSVVWIDYPTYMQALHNILNAPAHSFDLTTRIGMAPLAFALAAVSGRRMIEIMVHGNFTIVGKHQVEFFGQAKKRTGTDTGRVIYTLCDANVFMEKFELLRNCSAISDFDEIMTTDDVNDTRSPNAKINAVIAKSFNPWVKQFFNDDRRVYKDSRSIYARIAYETWFHHDSRWAEVDEDVFFSEILGHDDENTQLHYKQFKLHNFSRTWKPDVGNENQRLESLQQLDDEMLDFARGDAGVRIHEATKQIVEKFPNDLVTTSQLRSLGFNIPLTKRYLDFAADALEQEIGENGRYQLVDNSPNIIIQDDEDEELEADIVDDESIDDDEIEIDGETTENEPEPEPETEKEPEQTEQPKPTERPRFSAPHRRDDGQWVVRFEYSGQNYSWVGQADNLKEAMIQAWQAYFQ